MTSIRDGLHIGTRTPMPKPHDHMWRIEEKPTRPAIISATAGYIATLTGRSLVLNAAAAAASATTDATIWMIGGPSFLTPWAVDRADGGPTSIDWIAPTPETAVLMLTAAIDEIKSRKPSYMNQMMAHNSDRILPGNGRDICAICNEVHPPAIVILIAFTPDFEYQPEIADLIHQVIRIGQATAVTVLFAGGRAISSSVPAPALQRTAFRIAGPLFDEDEYAYLFGWTQHPIVRDAIYSPGQFFLQDTPDGPVDVAFVNQWTPSAIRTYSTVNAAERPDLDLGTTEYAQRWDHPDVDRFLTYITPSR